MRRRATPWIAPAVVCFLAAAPAAGGDGVVAEKVHGNLLQARIVLPGGIDADLTIEFEEVSGLERGSLGLSATLVNPNDPDLLSRLPNGFGLSVPAEFPVLVSTDPVPGLRLRGIATVELYTHDLVYTYGTPLRVFAGAPGGPLSDVTAMTAAGSYRAGSTTPTFGTEFLIVLDLRPSQVVAALKQEALDDLLGEHAGLIDPALLADLEDRLVAVRQATLDGDYQAAVAEIEGFIDAVTGGSGDGIPDVWQAGSTVQNAAGELRSQAWTLRYSLLQLASGLV